MNRVEEAVRLFEGGYSCSQAVLAAFSPAFGLESERAIRVASGFGSGMRLGGMCGAVTGGIMLLGLAHGDTEVATREGRARVAEAVDEFTDRFRERVGALDCPDIMGADVRVPEEREAAMERGLVASRCVPAVRAAAEILDEMLA